VDDIALHADDPHASDVLALITRHLEFTAGESPPGSVHALDAERLADPAVTFFSARRGGVLLAVGALKHLSAAHAELKSMHTVAEARGQGLGAAMLAHLLQVARRRKYTRVSLETGSTAAFTPARRLYARAGFTECEPFEDYAASVWSTFMTLPLPGTGEGP
jgi:putative acetyltransferase